MSGRPFLQIPGPTLVPDRIVRAMSRPIIDHRGPAFAQLVRDCIEGLQRVFQTSTGHIVIYPGSGTGAWEATIVNTLSPGDKVLVVVNGYFADAFARVARSYGIETEILRAPYGEAAPYKLVEERLTKDPNGSLRAVLVVHNETSTGVTSDIAAIRTAIDKAGHPALLLVDVVSSLASIDFRMDDWGVDVALSGPQKGLMLPPGLAILCVNEKAVEASKRAQCPRAFWDWQAVIESNQRGEYPYTPATSLLFGLDESLRILEEEGLPEVFRRHERFGEACRRGVEAMGLELLCRRRSERSSTVTAVFMPDGHDSGEYVRTANQRLAVSLGVGLGEVKGRVFRVGHLGSLNELELLAGIAGIEMTLHDFGVDVSLGRGVAAAEGFLLETLETGLSAKQRAAKQAIAQTSGE